MAIELEEVLEKLQADISETITVIDTTIASINANPRAYAQTKADEIAALLDAKSSNPATVKSREVTARGRISMHDYLTRLYDQYMTCSDDNPTNTVFGKVAEDAERQSLMKTEFEGRLTECTVVLAAIKESIDA